SIEQQLSWDSLPPQEDLRLESGGDQPAEVARFTTLAEKGLGGISQAPFSAERAYVSIFGINNPAVATGTGNVRLTARNASCDVRHIVLDFGATAFPVLEGQSIGILPPGLDANAKPHYVRLYSVASPRNGERPNYNNLSLTVKRVTQDHQGRA